MRKKIPSIFILLLVSICSFVSFSGVSCAKDKVNDAASEISFDKARAFSYLEYQVNAGFRVPGTKTHLEVKDWIVQTLTDAKASMIMTQPFTHMDDKKEIHMHNIIAEFKATSDIENPKTIVFAAHWDSRPISEKDIIEGNRTFPLPGANDGASGVAVLLEVANQLKSIERPCNVRLLFFDGEDYGDFLGSSQSTFNDLDAGNVLLGSKFYAQNHGKKSPDFIVLIDLIGKEGLTIYREPYSEVRAKEANDIVFSVAKNLGYTSVNDTSKPRFVDEISTNPIIDDHIPLLKVGIPSVCLIDLDYAAWHTTNDTVDKCSPDSLEMIGKVLLGVVKNGN